MKPAAPSRSPSRLRRNQICSSQRQRQEEQERSHLPKCTESPAQHPTQQITDVRLLIINQARREERSQIREEAALPLQLCQPPVSDSRGSERPLGFPMDVVRQMRLRPSSAREVKFWGSSIHLSRRLSSFRPGVGPKSEGLSSSERSTISSHPMCVHVISSSSSLGILLSRSIDRDAIWLLAAAALNWSNSFARCIHILGSPIRMQQEQQQSGSK